MCGGGREREVGEGKTRVRAKICHRYFMEKSPRANFCDFVFMKKGQSLTTLSTVCMSQNSDYLLETVLRLSELVGTSLCSKVIVACQRNF